jgi:hypothetical protein
LQRSWALRAATNRELLEPTGLTSEVTETTLMRETLSEASRRAVGP